MEFNYWTLHSIVVEEVNSFLSKVELVRSRMTIKTLVIRTTYGSRVFVKLKLKSSNRSLMKLVFKVGSKRDLNLLSQQLSFLERICAPMY